jgi:hypothetical protein
MEHIINQCPFSELIWDHASKHMRRTRRERNNIINTIKNWGNRSFQNPILNKIWKILLGFIVWLLWKERNRFIFYSQDSPPLSSIPLSTNMFRTQFMPNPRPRMSFPRNPYRSQFLQPGSLRLHLIPFVTQSCKASS